MYIGNKNIPGVIELLVNNLPKSNNYYSLFFGSGGLENSVYTSDVLFWCAEPNKECQKYQGPSSIIVENCYKDLIDKNDLGTRDFVFADPPYMFSTRAAGRNYYKHEFTDNDHEDFLKIIIGLECRIMITHPICSLYDKYLKGWVKIPFTYMSRIGIFNDCLWLNYDISSIELLNYGCIGNDFIERQRIKRQRNNILNKFKNLPYHVRKAIVSELDENGLLL